MTELENIKSLEKYDAWNKAKENRKGNIGLIASAIGFVISLLMVWLTLKVSPGDIWTLGKSTFADKEKIKDYVPKIEEIDNKLKNSLLSGPTKWLSKKHEEEIRANTIDLGLLRITPSLESSLKKYAWMLIGIWILALIIVWLIFAWLFYWIIGKFIWKEPTLTESFIKEKRKTTDL